MNIKNMYIYMDIQTSMDIQAYRDVNTNICVCVRMFFSQRGGISDRNHVRTSPQQHPNLTKTVDLGLGTTSLLLGASPGRGGVLPAVAWPNAEALESKRKSGGPTGSRAAGL